MLCVVARYEDQTLRWPLPDREVQLGASTDNEIVLPFPGVSRRHARISREGTASLRLVDLDSKNGLLVGGRRYREIVLSPGDSVLIGRVVVTLQDARTSDVEVALHLDGSAVSSKRHHTTQADEREDSMADIIRIVRQAEDVSRLTSARRQRLLDDARVTIGASGITVARFTAEGEVDVDCVSGSLAGDHAFRAVRQTLGTRRRGSFSGVREEGGTIHVCAGRGERFVVATMTRPGEPWLEEFLGFLATKFLHALPAETETVASDSTRDLTLPEGMVVGPSEAMQRLLRQMSSTVKSGMDVLLLGETGTGKELFARAVHATGPNGSGPFLAINCAAIPSELLEAELFGVQGRVATGVDPRPGLFQQADHGSVFLDEVGELAERLQAKLLRVLQEREVLPLGAPRPRRIDVRVISASNRDLAALVAEGRFRADLYYRLRGLQFEIPPLRDRKDDIAALVLAFSSNAAKEYGKEIRGVSRKALRMLEQHDWPGNVRELESEVRRAVLICPQGSALQPEHFTTVPRHSPAPVPEPHVAAMAPAQPEPDGARTLREQIDALERAEIERALAAARGNRSLAARMLGITRNGLALKLRRFSIGDDA